MVDYFRNAAMSSSGDQNAVPASFQSYVVPISTQQSSSTTQYESLASYYAQAEVRPLQSVDALSSSKPLPVSVNIVTVSPGMQIFST